MTKQEFARLIKAMQSNYDGMFKDMESRELWYRLLCDLDYEQASAALYEHMMTSPYRPTIADIRKNSAPKTELTEMEAWAMVRKAMRNGNYGSEEEFNKLPEIVQKAVGTASNIKQWAQTDSDMIETVEAHFLKAFRTATERANHEAQLSPAVKNLLSSMNQRMLEGA